MEKIKDEEQEITQIENNQKEENINKPKLISSRSSTLINLWED